MHFYTANVTRDGREHFSTRGFSMIYVHLERARDDVFSLDKFSDYYMVERERERATIVNNIFRRERIDKERERAGRSVREQWQSANNRARQLEETQRKWKERERELAHSCKKKDIAGQKWKYRLGSRDSQACCDRCIEFRCIDRKYYDCKLSFFFFL